MAQSLLRQMTENKDPEVAAIAIDLQQALPTPKINSGIQFYKRKLWTYNICIHNLKNRNASMYVWDESTGRRGSVEISSCLMHYKDNEISPDVIAHFQ